MSSEERYLRQRTMIVHDLFDRGDIRSQQVKEAMMSVPREHFVPLILKLEAYLDRPLPIGHGQTISAPHMVAIMADEMDACPGQKVLEIGTGSGYHAAVVSRLVLPGGHVYTVERVRPLVKFAEGNLAKAGIDNVTVMEGDGSIGLPEHAPYDRIYYTCAAPDVPEKVIEQLAEGGSILAVVGPRNGVQRLLRMKKAGGSMTTESLTHCVFVPLIGELGY
ncbi:MAG: protein-L-isoaspartate(D-aspartate) O-methyltransferase [Thermoplasmatota archaeon]